MASMQINSRDQRRFSEKLPFGQDFRPISFSAFFTPSAAERQNSKTDRKSVIARQLFSVRMPFIWHPG
jgi:hypothetical protein